MSRDDSGSDPASLGEVEITKATDKALFAVPKDDTGFWVPKSVVHDDSEVWKDGDKGDLVVKQWWAEKEGRV